MQLRAFRYCPTICNLSLETISQFFIVRLVQWNVSCTTDFYLGLADLYFFNLWLSLELEGCFECVLLSRSILGFPDVCSRLQMFVNVMFPGVIHNDNTYRAEKKAVVCLKRSPWIISYAVRNRYVHDRMVVLFCQELFMT